VFLVTAKIVNTLIYIKNMPCKNNKNIGQNQYKFYKNDIIILKKHLGFIKFTGNYKIDREKINKAN
jgi:hypothetical protein